MNGELIRLEVGLRSRASGGYLLGAAGYALVIVALYPSFKNDASLDELTRSNSTVAALFGATGPLTTPVGWLNANLYANLIPLIILMLSIGYGAACLAGQDEDGTLGMIATLPLSRRRIVAQKAVALLVMTLPVSVVTMIAVLIGRGFGLQVGIGNLVGVTVGVILLGVDFGAIAMLVGTLSGSRGSAVGITSGLAVLGYLLSSLGPSVHWLRPARYASPFFYAVGDGQLDHGLRPAWAAVLGAVAIVSLVGCLTSFDRFDVH